MVIVKMMEKKYVQRVSKAPRARQREKSFLRLKIMLDRVKIEMGGNDAQKCLREVNRLLDRVSRAAYENSDELGIDYRLEGFLSDELMLNRDVTKALNQLSEIYHDYRTSRIAVENKRIVELEQGKVENQLDFNDVRTSVTKLLFHIQKDRVKHAVIHIKGAVKEEEAQKVTDLIKQELHGAEVHTVFTQSDVLSHTIVEGVFFGEFGAELGED